jgi:HSP20 family protein
MKSTTTNVPVAEDATKPVSGAAHPLASLRQEMDRVLDQFTSRIGTWPLATWPFGRRATEWPELLRSTIATNVPAVDVAETDQDYTITAEMPGMDEKDIELTVVGDLLRIRGEKREEKEEKRTDYYVSERRYGSFERSFTLPAGADREKIAAAFSKGVLTITLPKRPDAQTSPRKIAVKAG